MYDRGSNATYEVEREIAQVPETVLDVTAKHPQKQHVPKDVQPAPVEEHASYQRNGRGPYASNGMGQHLFGTDRHHSHIRDEYVLRLGRKRQLKEKHEKIE